MQENKNENILSTSEAVANEENVNKISWLAN